MAEETSRDLDRNLHVSKLIQCVQSGSLRDLNSLVSDQVDLHAIDHDGTSLLHHAVSNPNTDVLEHLIGAGLSVVAQDDMYATPLLHCAAKGTLENLRVLVDKGADLESKDIEGNEAIHHAVRNDNAAAIIQFLLDQGLSIEALDDFGRTPLHHCAQYGTLQTMKTLISKGGTIRLRSATEMTTLHFAALNEKTSEITDFLVGEGMPTEARDVRGLTALHLSIIHANLHNTKVLVEKGANVKGVAINGITPMHMAASYGDTTETLQLLFDKGASINARDVNGRTPLLTCAAEGTLEKMKFLIEKGADIQDKDLEAVSALHFAATNDNTTDIIQFLLDEGIAMEMRDNFHRTPLLFSASDGNLECVKFLVEKGADMKAVTEKGFTVISLAIRNNQRGPLVDYILSRPADTRPDMDDCPPIPIYIPIIPPNRDILLDYGPESYRYDDARARMNMLNSFLESHSQRRQ